MPLKIIRNDITKMNTDAIVNTANGQVAVGPGCDRAVYTAAGYEALHRYRAENIGPVPEGEVFITPGFQLEAGYIIHAVSPRFVDGQSGEEEKLRSCYRKSLQLAQEHHFRSIAFPLISTGSFSYPKEEGMRIAVDEINAFLLRHEMLVYLVVFGERATALGEKIYPDLERYIDRKYVLEREEEEYGYSAPSSPRLSGNAAYPSDAAYADSVRENRPRAARRLFKGSIFRREEEERKVKETPQDFDSLHERKLEERMQHVTDTFSQYLLYLIREKNMENADVYKRAIVNKKIFSKIKNNIDYHPQKLTALCLCVGAKLNLDESKDLLARAGYALSPCDKTDIIFSYFIENQIYDMIELDIQLEEHGLPCIIS